MIIINPLEGLGNRMRAVNSARALCRHLGTRCIIVWRRDEKCNCRYSDLFLPDGFSWVIEGFLADRHKPLNPVFYHIKLDYNEIAQKINDTDFFESLDPNKRIYVRTWDAFYPASDYRLFVPVPHLMKRIKAVTGMFEGPTIGVHIRRSDHLWSNEHSPTEKFVRYMEKEIRSDPAVNFFLATDSSEEEEMLRARFGDRIKSCKKTYSRDTLAGMEDALVDMYCLAATQRIYASWCSSFSTVASQINHRELIPVYE